MEGDSRLNCRGRGGGRGQSSLSCSCNIYSSAQERLRPRHLYQKFYQVIREVLISHTLVLFSLEDMKNSHTLTQESRFLPGSSSEVEITIQPRYYFIMYFVCFFLLKLMDSFYQRHHIYDQKFHPNFVWISDIYNTNKRNHKFISLSNSWRRKDKTMETVAGMLKEIHDDILQKITISIFTEISYTVTN